MSRRTAAAATLALLAPLVTAVPAHAHTTGTAQATAACSLGLGSVNANGDHLSQGITAGNPPTASQKGVVAKARFTPGITRLHSTWTAEPEVPQDTLYSGYVVLNATMYAGQYQIGAVQDESLHLSRIGAGWDQFTYFERSQYDEGAQPGGVAHTHYYGLREDGTLFRWKDGWKADGSYGGFGAVKTMALISQTRTYDTFIANTRGGALYTIHIPVTSPLKPIVKQIRPGTWQGFESLVAERCGQYGTMLLGIDKDTKTGYLYAVGHATGSSTVINGLGKVPTTFNDPVYFRWTAVPWASDPLNGE
ncbi:hypothetical protein AB0E69_20335 [Kribbella sp. NPDC026611]|uniref:hypothetical protein n=1 Tax=Kribbella sp. NPDC026611 TaxID=3154911 RepID=UPI0033C19A5F